jgi:uncharacterized membrane protein
MDDTDTVYFDATLRPHRSLDERGFLLVMGAVAAGGFLIGTAFFMAGAWPVAGFAGLEILLVYIAFRMNFRDARRHERLRLSDSGLEISVVDPSGKATTRVLEPSWVNVSMDDPPEHHSKLTLGSHGIRYEVGRFLQPEEKVEVARELRAAIQRYRSAPV